MPKNDFENSVPVIMSSEMFRHLVSEDALGAVVRGHLHLEGLVNGMLCQKVNDTSALSRLNLSYEKKIDLLAALGFKESLVAPLKAIGRLRNKFAHDLNTKMQKDVIDNLYASLGNFENKVLDFSRTNLDWEELRAVNGIIEEMDIRSRFALWIVFLHSMLFLENMRLGFGEW